MSRQRNINIIKHIGWLDALCGASAVALALAGLIILSPHVVEETNAESIATVNAEVTPVMSVALDNPMISIPLTPTRGGAYSTGSSKLVVNTNNATGYSLYFSTASGEASLTSTSDSTNKINPMITNGSFTNNTWGYSLDSTSEADFKAVPASLTSVASQASSGTKEYNLSFGVKVDSSIPAGTYTNQVIISAIANPKELHSMNDLFYMQDMTTALCQNTPGTDGDTTIRAGKEPSRQLMDIRDGKVYWVSRLADGNCWMTQNLALDIDAEKGLKAADTDISVDWNKDSQYPPESTRSSLNFKGLSTDNYTSTASWNLGEYIKSPTDYTMCDIQENEEASVCPGYTKYNGTQDTHYLIGNYYQWNTVIAGTAVTQASTGENGNLTTIVNAPESICPKNWQLPNSDGNDAANKSAVRFGTEYFQKFGNKTNTNILNAYGFSFPTFYPSTDLLYGRVIQNGRDVRAEPIYFFGVGTIAVGQNKLGGGNRFLRSWTSTLYPEEHRTYATYNDGSSLFASNALAFFDGAPVRCLAR